MFSLEKLKVYDRALACVARLAQLTARWHKRHAVVDQLLRASESVLLNLAEAARLRAISQRQHVLDYAIGSALECAACLDISLLKQFVAPAVALDHKKQVAAYVDLSQRMGELNPGQRTVGIGLVDQIAIMIRGLSAC